MAFSFLTEENLVQLYTDAKEYTEKLTENFPEFSRIARNKPHPKTPKRFPKTTDGTAASIINKSPRRVIQQLPTGVIESEKDNDHWPIIADYKYRSEILPNANSEYDLIHKCWITVENGQTFGSQAIYTPIVDHGGIVTPDYITVYWGDVSIQPGRKSAYDSSYAFIDTWWQEGDVDELIEAETNAIAEARASKQTYKATWDLENLQVIKNAMVQKDETSETPQEQELNLDAKGIRVVLGLQNGTGNIFYTFCPDVEEDYRIVRRQENDDPRGKYPLDWYYYDVDGSNPLGRSLLDLIGPLQNLIDADMQAYQYNRAIALQPPINAFGNVNTARISYAPNAINKFTDANAKVEPMTIDTSAIINYPSLYGLQKSQMLNLVGSPDTSISAEVGNPGFGKTPTAIKTQNAAISVDDNALRKGFEAMFENWSETAINLYFSSRSGVETGVQLDKETANKLRDLEEEGHLDAGYVSDDDTIDIDYDEAIGALKFKVNASTSKVNTEAAQLEALQVLTSTLDSSASMSEVVPVEQKLKVWNAIAANSGIEDSDDLKVSEEELSLMQQAASAEVIPPEGEELPLEPIEEGLEEEYNPATDDELIAQHLRDLGLNEDYIAQIPELIEKGYTPDEVMYSVQRAIQDMESREEI